MWMKGIFSPSLMAMVILLLYHLPRRICSLIKLFSCFCEENGKPTMDRTKISKAEYDQFRSTAACWRGIENVTNPLSSKSNLLRPTNATMPRNVTSSTSTPMISPSHDSQDDQDSASKISELQHVFIPSFVKLLTVHLSRLWNTMDSQLFRMSSY